MDSLVEPRWPPGLAVMKVSALGRSGALGCLQEASFAVRRRKAETRAASWARVAGSALPLTDVVDGPQFPPAEKWRGPLW